METRSDKFLLDVARGEVYGASIIHKFGSHIVGTVMMPITTSGLYQTPITSQILEVVSDDAQDALGNSGAQSVRICGIGEDWTEQSVVVELNGITPVTIALPFRRVYRFKVEKSGTYADPLVGSHAGTLVVRGVGNGVLWAEIGFSGGIPIGTTEIGCFTVPKGYEALVLHRTIQVETAKMVDISFFFRENADVLVAGDYTPMLSSGLLRNLSGLSIDNSSAGYSELLKGPCDIGFMGASSAQTSEISVAFEILLLKQKL